MTWQQRGGIQVWADPVFPEPDDTELAPYSLCATPIPERPHPTTCGRPGTGRAAHARHGEPSCGLCIEAERLYTQRRRQARLS